MAASKLVCALPPFSNSSRWWRRGWSRGSDGLVFRVRARFLLELFFFFFIVPLPLEIEREPPELQPLKSLVPHLCKPVRCRVPAAASAALAWHRRRKFHRNGFRGNTSASGSPGVPCARSRSLA